MFQTILVPLDGSPRAEQALPVAARIARASGGSILLLQVVSPTIDYGGGMAMAPMVTEQVIKAALTEAASYLNRVIKSQELAGIDITTETMFGMPAQDILDMTESRSVDLIVMCSHGRTGFTRWVLGSVAQKVIKQGPVPVLVLREGKPLPPVSRTDVVHPLCALVALDGSAFAETALAPAANLVAALATPAQGALHLTQVVKQLATTADKSYITRLNEEAVQHAEAYLAAVKQNLQETRKDLNLSITWSVAFDSDVASAIIGIAEHGGGRGAYVVAERSGADIASGVGGQEAGADGFGGCDLVAMSTHGRGGLERWMIGSVTERVLNATKLPLLVVRPQRAEPPKG